MAPEPQCSGDSRIGRERESSLLCPTGANSDQKHRPFTRQGRLCRGLEEAERKGREEGRKHNRSGDKLGSEGEGGAGPIRLREPEAVQRGSPLLQGRGYRAGGTPLVFRQPLEPIGAGHGPRAPPTASAGRYTRLSPTGEARARLGLVTWPRPATRDPGQPQARSRAPPPTPGGATICLPGAAATRCRGPTRQGCAA